MTDARCVRCAEKEVGVSDIIHAGHGDRYQVWKCSFPLLSILGPFFLLRRYLVFFLNFWSYILVFSILRVC